MSVTIREIARLAGVSRGTVDRVLNGRGRVRPEVAAEVERIAKESGYVPKHPKPETEKLSAGGAGKKIGVITQLSKSSFMLEVNRGIADIARKLGEQGIEVMLKESESVDEAEQLQAIDALEVRGMDALAIMPVDCDAVRVRLNRLIHDGGIPVITFNSDIVGTDRMCFVGLNNRQSGRTAAGLMGLMLQGQGRVLAITGNFANSTGGRRIAGFVEELKQSFPNMELVGVHGSFDRTDEVERIIVNAMTAFEDLAGILVVSGGQAGVKLAFEKLRPPKRPFVILYDLTPKNAGYLEEGIVDFLIDQEGYMQGYRAISLLADWLQTGEQPGQEYMYTEISIKTKYNLV